LRRATRDQTARAAFEDGWFSTVGNRCMDDLLIRDLAIFS
jgi:hypothetical protein